MAASFFRPIPKREFRGQRWARILLRTTHLVFMALLLGRVALGEPVAELSWPFWGTVVSGSVFVLLELHCSFVFLLQLKGLAVVAKMLLLAAAGFSSGGGSGMLIVAIVIGGISSHMPGRFRYYSIFHGREVKE